MEMETESEDRLAIGHRRRVLITATVAAVVGSRARILEINLVEQPSRTGWKHCGNISKPAERAIFFRRFEIRATAAREEEECEASYQA